MKPEYLDYNATTPLDPRVFEVMKEWYLGPPANAGSRTHVYGQRAKVAVENARQQIAEVIAAKPEEIYFTSGATESNNLAILGLTAFGERTGRKHIVSTAIEHKSVLEPLEEMKRRGFEVDVAPVTRGGFVEVEAIEKLLRPDTLLVSVMHANNETGILQPIIEIAELVSGTPAFFHTDAAQTFGKEINELREAQCDFISISGHKVFGPQGVCAIVAKRLPGKKRPLKPLLFGGGQERGIRSGTVPIPQVVGFGEASRLALNECRYRKTSVENIREQLFDVLKKVDHLIIGDNSRCQQNVVSIRFPGIDSEALMMAAKNLVAISNGSACTSESYSPSHVLLAMGLDGDEATETVRLSWGTGSKTRSLEQLIEIVKQLSMKPDAIRM